VIYFCVVLLAASTWRMQDKNHLAHLLTSGSETAIWHRNALHSCPRQHFLRIERLISLDIGFLSLR
jgi:hypothetical protein